MTLPARAEAPRAVRNAVAERLRREQWPPDRVLTVLLATEEAMTNAVEHGSLPEARVRVEVEVAPARARVLVVDAGRPGRDTPLNQPVLPPTTSPRGRGRVIMGALANRFETRAAAGGTAVLLEFERDDPARLAD